MKHSESRINRMLPGALVVAALLWGPGAALAGGQWHTVDTSHYEVTTDVSPAFGELVGQHMEAIHREYELRFRDYGIREHERFRVRVFSSQRDYDEAVPSALRGSTGAFVSDPRLLAAYKEGRTDEDVFRTLYHEGFHQFLFSSVSTNVPVWFNEGFAEYFSEAKWNGGRFTAGAVPWARLNVIQEAIRQGRHLPLTQLFGMDSKTWLARLRNDPEVASMQYCQAWSVVHFLLHAKEGRYRRRAMGYLKSLSQGVDRREAFVASFGSDIESFERAWASYVSRLKIGPDEVCRKNLEVIAFLGMKFQNDPDRFTSVDGLRRALTEDKNLHWTVTTSDGETITSQDRRRAAELFRCPRDSSGRPGSYILLQDHTSGHPALYCTHHRGFVMKAYYVPDDGDAAYSVRVERIVSATLPKNVVEQLREGRARLGPPDQAPRRRRRRR